MLLSQKVKGNVRKLKNFQLEVYVKEKPRALASVTVKKSQQIQVLSCTERFL